ncbi:MAG: hypothetical protein J7K26_02305 [Candidatus Aenigmarchaeota archaeon]|nr:hypothetical protein [Candidatus Aenigmarchaeota archaeon]
MKKVDKTTFALFITVISFGVMYLFRGIDMANDLIGKTYSVSIIIGYIIAGLCVVGLGFYILYKR